MIASYDPTAPSEVFRNTGTFWPYTFCALAGIGLMGAALALAGVLPALGWIVAALAVLGALAGAFVMHDWPPFMSYVILLVTVDRAEFGPGRSICGGCDSQQSFVNALRTVFVYNCADDLMTTAAYVPTHPDNRLTGWKLAAARAGWLAFLRRLASSRCWQLCRCAGRN